MQKEFVTSVKGVSFEDNGVRRQEHVRSLVEGQELYVKRDEQNPFDLHALLIFADKECTKRLGHVPRELSSAIAVFQAQGWTYRWFVKKRTGGPAPRLYGCNIRVVAEKAD